MNPQNYSAIALLILILKYKSLTYMCDCCCGLDWLQNSKDFANFRVKCNQDSESFQTVGWENEDEGLRVRLTWVYHGSAIYLCRDLGDVLFLISETEMGASTL